MKLLFVLLLALTGCSSSPEKLDTGDIDAQNQRGESPLLIAVHNNDVEAAIELIDKGADVNLQDHIQDSPYLYAGANGRYEIIDYMLNNATIDYTVRNRFGGNTLIPAAEKGHLTTLILLLEKSSEPIDFQNNFGYTALIEAVALSDGSQIFQDIVRALVENGASLDIKDNKGLTALDYAIKLGYTEIIEILEHEN